ncbi:hypothetical protein Nham_3356 [Nitrobacter hamburgensis X14]|uniref:Uncharacterized protein n=1 Tax=Nitrobacter hamburgensis (strain DSM 10229 / NCIMB 13809 / X14) TaxID=323097 RepID=Q1QI60_NITHX|nr:hypothetical protein [Nitrobacter hamburgensis]ABE64087.1 hypothetical protein Nham_3356 [Nitrobacter hamburgensis X14]
MEFVHTTLLKEPWDVDRRLNAMTLVHSKLLQIRDVAVNEAANATPFHAANAAGTFSYHHGTWALRDQFAGPDWVVDRSEGVEAIRNDKAKIKVAFCNVDLACDEFHIPQPRTKKGAGVERATSGSLFDDLPQIAPKPTGEWQFYYLMVDECGAAELTRPIVKGGTFTDPLERIFLSNGVDDDSGKPLEDTTDTAIEFEPQIARK